MRELRFRAWDRKNRRMIPDFWRTYKKKDFVMMQSTGLLDINRKIIYEGDILRCHEDCNLSDPSDSKYETIGTVVFDESVAAFFCVPLGGNTDEVADDYIPNVGPEIIGNIFETPELLKGTEQRNTLRHSHDFSGEKPAEL